MAIQIFIFQKFLQLFISLRIFITEEVGLLIRKNGIVELLFFYLFWSIFWFNWLESVPNTRNTFYSLPNFRFVSFLTFIFIKDQTISSSSQDVWHFGFGLSPCFNPTSLRNSRYTFIAWHGITLHNVQAFTVSPY